VLDPVAAANLYDGELRFMDEQVGVLLDTVRELGVAGETIIVVMGDHGEGLGQHGQSGHGVTWGEQLHAPFWIFSPWHAARRVDVPVTAQDVFPTLLGLIELPGEEQFFQQSSGVDALSDAVRRPVLHLSSAHQSQLGRSPEAALTVGTWRFHTNLEGEDRLYELQSDPHELVSVHDAYPLHRSLMGRWTDSLAAERAARGATLGTTREVVLDPERVEQLRALGYTE
jgi:choline-sulfatase